MNTTKNSNVTLIRSSAVFAIILWAILLLGTAWNHHVNRAEVGLASLQALSLAYELNQDSSADLNEARAVYLHAVNETFASAKPCKIRFNNITFDPAQQLAPIRELLSRETRSEQEMRTDLAKAALLLKQLSDYWRTDANSVSIVSSRSDIHLRQLIASQKMCETTISNARSLETIEQASAASRWAALATIIAWHDLTPIQRKAHTDELAEEFARLQHKMEELERGTSDHNVARQIHAHVSNIRVRNIFLATLCYGGAPEARSYLVTKL